MRSTFLLLLLSLGTGGYLLMHARHPSTAATPPGKPASVSQHDWAKQALDRTDEVKLQVAKHRQESDDIK